MPRAHLYRTIQALGGSLVTGAQVTVYEPSTTTLVAQTLYSTLTGSATLSNPFSASSGVIDFFLTNPQDVDIKIDYGLSSLVAESQSVLPPAGTLFAAGSPMTITNGASPGYVLLGTDATHAQWVDPLSITTDRPDTGMPIPSTLTVQVRNGIGFVSWDGLDHDGQAMPDDFDYLTVWEVGDSPRALGALLQAGSLVPNVDPGVSLQSVAVNKAGNAGSPSTLVTYPATTVVVAAGPPDLLVGGAGTAPALPSAPVRYLPILGANGETYRIALYADS